MDEFLEAIYKIHKQGNYSEPELNKIISKDGEIIDFKYFHQKRVRGTMMLVNEVYRLYDLYDRIGWLEENVEGFEDEANALMLLQNEEIEEEFYMKYGVSIIDYSISKDSDDNVSFIAHYLKFLHYVPNVIILDDDFKLFYATEKEINVQFHKDYKDLSDKYTKPKSKKGYTTIPDKNFDEYSKLRNRGIHAMKIELTEVKDLQKRLKYLTKTKDAIIKKLESLTKEKNKKKENEIYLISGIKLSDYKIFKNSKSDDDFIEYFLDKLYKKRDIIVHKDDYRLFKKSEKEINKIIKNEYNQRKSK